VWCASNRAHDVVERMEQQGVTFVVSDKLIIRAIRKNGIVIGVGMIVVQTGDPEQVVDLNPLQQYQWLVASWCLSHGIGPGIFMQLHEDDLDPDPNAPVIWK
jgi:hypothetical protein